MVESGYSQFTPPAPDVDVLTCSDFHLALTDEKPSSLADTNAGDTERLMARLSAAKSPDVVTFQDALKSLDRLANRPARLAIDTDSIYIPPLKKTHRQEEGRETRAASRPKTIAVVQSADIQLFWSVLSTSFFWVIPPGSWVSTARRASCSNSRASHSILRSGL